MKITIREAVESDLPELAKLFTDSVQKIAPQRYSPEQVAAWAAAPSNPERFHQFILEPTTFVALADDQIVGFAGIAAIGYVTSLYVHGDYSRQGIGSKLLETVLEYSRDHKIERLYLEASEFSRPLFEKFGFEVYDTEQVVRNGVSFDRYLMRDKLNSR